MTSFPEDSNVSSKNNPFGEDKRYIPRWEVNNRILYQVNDSEALECLSKDISCTGACLLVNKELSLQEKLRLKIYLEEGASVSVNGRVAWCKRVKHDQYLIGISFDGPTPEAQETILNYAFEIRRKDVVNHWFKGWA